MSRPAAPAPPRPVADDDRTVLRAARRGPARHRRLVLGGLGLLLLGVLAARVLLGDYTVTVPDLVRILTDRPVPGAARLIVMEVTLPRALLALLVGACFGVGGAVFQATLRNPLASPDVLGVSLGASAGAVLALVTLDLRGPAVSAAAVTGALLVAAAVRGAAGGARGGPATYRLVLVGVAAAAGLQSLVQYLFVRADVYDAQLALRWLTGSVSAADWPTLRLLGLLLLAGLPVLVWVARTLPVLELGPDAAAALGLPARSADTVLAVAVVLVAVGVAAAGPVAFVAFLAGPLARALNGGRTTLVGSGLVGAVVVVAADYAADYLVPGGNYPVGVVTGAVGAPFLLWLLARGRLGRTRA